MGLFIEGQPAAMPGAATSTNGRKNAVLLDIFGAVAFVQTGIGEQRITPALVREHHERIPFPAIPAVSPAQHPDRFPGLHKYSTVVFVTHVFDFAGFTVVE